VHVKTTTVRQGKTAYRYLSLVESYREDGRMRHRTVARLGEALALAASGQPRPDHRRFVGSSDFSEV
jgi:hypothetical protein